MEHQNKNSSEEIDLLNLFKRTVQFALRSLTVYTRILLRNALLFISIFAFICIVGFSARFFLPNYYRTQAIFIAHYMPADIYGLLLDDLSNLASNGSEDALISEELKISMKSAAAIHAIETQPLRDQNFRYKNDTAAVNAFRVTILLKEIGGLKEIQEGLKNYLEKNEYSQRKRIERIRKLELIKSDLLTKKNSLDSLQQKMNKPGNPSVSGQVIVLTEAFMPIEAYKMQQDYNTKLLELEQQLTMVDNVEIAVPFTRITKPNSRNFNRLFMLSLVAAFALSLLLTPLLGKRSGRSDVRFKI